MLHVLDAIGAFDVSHADDVLVVKVQQNLDLAQRPLAICLVVKRRDFFDGHFNSIFLNLNCSKVF